MSEERGRDIHLPEPPEVESAAGIRVSRGAIQNVIAFLTIFAFVLGVCSGVVNWVKSNSLDIAQMQWRITELEKRGEARDVSEREAGKRLDDMNTSLVEIRTTLKEVLIRYQGK